MMKYTINPDGTVNTVVTDTKSDIRRVLSKFEVEVEVSEDMQEYDSHRLFK